MSNATDKKVQAIVYPINVEEFDISKVVFEPKCKIVTKNPSIPPMDVVPLKYMRDDDPKAKFMVKIKGCQVIKVNEPDASLPGVSGNYSLFLAVHDENIANFANLLNERIREIGLERFDDWFPGYLDNLDDDTDKKKDKKETKAQKEERENELRKDAIDTLISPFIKSSDMTFGVVINAFTKHTNTQYFQEINPNYASADNTKRYPKGTVVDLCIEFDRIKFSNTKIRPNLRLIQIVAYDIKEIEIPNSIYITPGEPWVPELLKLKDTITNHKKGGKFFNVLYDNKPVKFKLCNLSGVIVSNADMKSLEDPTKTNRELGKTSYTLAINVPSENTEFLSLLTTVNDRLFAELCEANKKLKILFPTLIKKMYKKIFNYGKKDLEAIAAGQKPRYDQVFYVKLYYNPENAENPFGSNKFINSETNELVKDIETIISHRITIVEANIYIRHMWIAANSISTNFTLSKLIFSDTVQSYGLALDAPEYSVDPRHPTSKNNDKTTTQTNNKSANVQQTQKNKAAEVVEDEGDGEEFIDDDEEVVESEEEIQ